MSEEYQSHEKLYATNISPPTEVDYAYGDGMDPTERARYNRHEITLEGSDIYVSDRDMIFQIHPVCRDCTLFNADAPKNEYGWHTAPVAIECSGAEEHLSASITIAQALIGTSKHIRQGNCGVTVDMRTGRVTKPPMK